MYDHRIMRRLPPLDSLRAFEAAARHLSFTKAAAELHVTQSAVSHRINGLEEELGVTLFRRLTRRMELTPAGERLALGVRRGLAEFVAAVTAVDPRRTSSRLVVSVLPSFGQRWLVPRLGRLRDCAPEIEVQVAADPKPINLHAGGADVAIRFGRGQYPDLHVVRLMGDGVVPVCSPKLIERFGPITAPAEIGNYPLLHDHATARDGSGTDWGTWLAHVGAPQVSWSEGLRFDQANMLLEAAVQGLGVALGRCSLIEDDIATGRLMRALPHEAPTIFEYYFVCLPEVVDRPAIASFLDWVQAESRICDAGLAANADPT